MKTQIYILFALLFGFLTFNNIYSQDGLIPGSSIANPYNVNTVESISGEVISIDNVNTGNNVYGMHMIIYSSNGQISVILGPVWFVENQEVQIVAGDFVIATGSRITEDGNQVIIAKEVMKEDKVLMLRDDNGYPLWSANGIR